MRSRASYHLTAHILDGAVVVGAIHDLGPHDRHPTVTNDAEAVVEDVLDALKRRMIFGPGSQLRLIYKDSDGRWDGLGVIDGRFSGFVPLGEATEEEAVKRVSEMSGLAWKAESSGV